ncbi:MAG TPA: ABC transporter substrate-binding protein [Thermoanaerobaculaceae bacterium]|nr:ABC transporter substrate-binding protein [Thermoanaerobaculaceae bacterium]HRS15419.1 ABC transporter substrate-binding protein [Thermoanaerobaculaceae bacterium]
MARSALLFALVILSAACGGPPPRLARLAYQHELVTLDPHNHNDSTTGALLSAVYEPLVALDPERGVQPRLAVEWENPSPTLWRFRLRPGVLFHDGRPVSADDVVATFKRVRFDIGMTVATYMDVVEQVRKAEDDPGVVEVETRAPTPLLLHRIGMVAIAPQFFDPQRPNGTGPYRWESGRERGPIVLRRWDRYWGEPAPMAEVEVRFVPVGEQLSEELRAARLDVMSGVTLDYVRRGPLPRGWEVVEIPTLGTTMLGINVTKPVLADPRVREAIELAVDPEALTRAAFPERGGSAAWTLLPARVFGADLAQRRQPPDRDRARRLLDEAGVAPGARFELLALAVDTRAVGELVQQLAAVGIVAEPVEASYELSYRRMMEADTELFVFGWNFRVGDPSDFLDSMVHSRSVQRRLGLQNGSGYSSQAADALIEALSQETDPARRGRMVGEVMAAIGHDRPYLPVYYHARFALVRRPFRLGLRAGLWALPQEIRVEP